MATIPRGRGDASRARADLGELRRLTRDLDAVADLLANDTAHISELARIGRDMIRTRTLKGISTKGNPFAPYSGGGVHGRRAASGRFARSRGWAGVRRDAGLRTRPVTLRFSGKMYDAIDWRVDSPLRATLYVRPLTAPGSPTPRDEIAEHHQRNRPFMGFTDKQRTKLKREGAAILTKLLLGTINDSRPVGPDISILRGRYKLKSERGQIREPRGSYRRRSA